MTKRNRREHGRIISVETMTRGDALAADVAAGATSITVNDAGDFDEDGGWLYIGAQTVEYTACDDDTGIITLATALTAAGEQGDPVQVWSDLYGEVVDYQLALVELDGEYDNPDPVAAEVAEGVGDLPEGDRGKAGESCTLKRVADDEWEVVGVGGRSRKSRGLRAEAHDAYTLTAADITAGTATIPLSHRPEPEWMKAWWLGLFQEPTSYTVNYDAQTITWPLTANVEKAGDRIAVHYAYRKGVVTAAISSIVTVEIPWNGTAGSSLTGSDGHSVVGTGQVLMDGSDATYVNYSGSGGGAAVSSMEVPSVTIPSSGLTAYVDWKTTFAGSPAETFNVIINQGGFGNLAGWYYNSSPAAVIDLGGGWKRFPLTFVDQGGFVLYVNGGSATGGVNCLGPSGKVYEAKLVVSWDTA